jgi:hypothetical protein
VIACNSEAPTASTVQQLQRSQSSKPEAVLKRAQGVSCGASPPSCDVALAMKRAAPDERASPIGSLATRPAAAGNPQFAAELPMHAMISRVQAVLSGSRLDLLPGAALESTKQMVPGGGVMPAYTAVQLLEALGPLLHGSVCTIEVSYSSALHDLAHPIKHLLLQISEFRIANYDLNIDADHD